MRKKAFTLIELLVVIAIIALLISILVPSLAKARELARRAACAANLNGVGKAIVLYQGANNDRYPLLSSVSADVACFTTRANLFGSGGITGTLQVNPVDNLQLLIKENMVPWKMLRCPSVSTEIMDRTGSSKTFGLVDAGTLYTDYAYQWCAPGGSNVAPVNDNLEPSVAILADQHGTSMKEFKTSPTDTAGQDGTGYNHKDDGVNVLYMAWNVAFSAKSIKAGYSKNNIYTKDMDASNNVGTDTTTVAVPVSRFDSVLVNAKP